MATPCKNTKQNAKMADNVFESHVKHTVNADKRT